VSDGTTAAADHHGAGIASGYGALGIDHPKLAELVADE
jgi:hypothetical protein